jgi:hypothetical protein
LPTPKFTLTFQAISEAKGAGGRPQISKILQSEGTHQANLAPGGGRQNVNGAGTGQNNQANIGAGQGRGNQNQGNVGGNVGAGTGLNNQANIGAGQGRGNQNNQANIGAGQGGGSINVGGNAGDQVIICNFICQFWNIYKMHNLENKVICFRPIKIKETLELTLAEMSGIKATKIRAIKTLGLTLEEMLEIKETKTLELTLAETLETKAI